MLPEEPESNNMGTSPTVECNQCGKQINLLRVDYSGSEDISCPHCGFRLECDHSGQSKTEGLEDWKKVYREKTHRRQREDAKGVKSKVDVQQLLERPTDCLAYFYGEWGTGKTVQLTCAVRDALKDNYPHRGCGFSAKYMTEPKLFRALRNTFDHDTKTIESTLKEYKEADLLALDEVGAAQYTDWSRDQLFDLFDYRFQELKATIIASNYSLDTLRSFDNYGNRLVSRFLQWTGGKRIYQLTTNYRKEYAK